MREAIKYRNIERRSAIKFLTKQGKPPKTILKEMSIVYGNTCPAKTMVYKCHSLFKQDTHGLDETHNRSDHFKTYCKSKEGNNGSCSTQNKIVRKNDWSIR